MMLLKKLFQNSVTFPQFTVLICNKILENGQPLAKIFENWYDLNTGEYIYFMRFLAPQENLTTCKTKASPRILKISKPHFTFQTQNQQPPSLRGSRSYPSTLF